jgi:hypothetical protein
MKRLGAAALAAGLLLASGLAPAAENRLDDVASTADSGLANHIKRRPLLDLISLAISSGRDTNINEDMAALLGLRPDLRARVLRVPARLSPDHAEHAFSVVYKPQTDGVDPVGILLDVETVDLLDGMKWVSRRTMLLSMEGALEKAAGVNSGFKTVHRSSMTVNAVQSLYKDELQFYENPSVGLTADQ